MLGERVTSDNVMRDNKLDAVRRWVGDSKRWLETFLTAAPKDHSIAAIIVVGSAVRDRGHRRSDFDLLVLYRGKRPAIEAPVEVDIRLYPIEAIKTQLAAGHEVICWAMKFGTALYDPQGEWESLKRSWGHRLPLPSADEAAKRGCRSLNTAKEMLSAGDDSAASDLILAALTQFVRARLIRHNVFPASRPELPDQLRMVCPSDALAQLLEDAMYQDVGPSELVDRMDAIVPSTSSSN